jgi:hypothetical protein
MKKVNKDFCKNTMLIKEQGMMDFFLTLLYLPYCSALFKHCNYSIARWPSLSAIISKKKIFIYISLKFVFSLLKKKENSNISLAYGGIKLLWLRDSPFLQRVSWGQIEWILKSWRNVVIRFCCTSSTETKKR